MSAATHWAHVVPGLSGALADELRSAARGRVHRVIAGFDRRNDIVVFDHAAAPRDVLGLRVSEDVFALALLEDGLPAGQPALAAVRRGLLRAPAVAAAADAASSLRRGRKASARVVARLAGRSDLHRSRLADTARRALFERFPRWKPGGDDARFELWVQVVGSTAVAGFRLSDARMRDRGGRAHERVAALKPTVAHAMLAAAGARPRDVVCDPMCGAGTILSEAVAARVGSVLVGGDIEPAAAAAAADNARAARVAVWDAARLPLADGSVDRIVTNPPFGHLVKARGGVRQMYAGVLGETRRVLRRGGTAAVLAGDEPALRAALPPGLELTAATAVVVRGRDASLVVLTRTA